MEHSSNFKRWGADALETIRRSVGGHAYSAYNAIASHIADFAVVTTGGGKLLCQL